MTITFGVALQVIQTIVTIAIGIIAFLFKREFTRIDERLERLEKFKDDSSEKFVRKDDYLQTTGEIMKRLDEIYKMVYNLAKERKNGG